MEDVLDKSAEMGRNAALQSLKEQMSFAESLFCVQFFEDVFPDTAIIDGAQFGHRNLCVI